MCLKFQAQKKEGIKNLKDFAQADEKIIAELIEADEEKAKELKKKAVSIMKEGDEKNESS